VHQIRIFLFPNVDYNSTTNLLSATSTLFNNFAELGFGESDIAKDFWIHGRVALVDTREIEGENPEIPHYNTNVLRHGA